MLRWSITPRFTGFHRNFIQLFTNILILSPPVTKNIEIQTTACARDGSMSEFQFRYDIDYRCENEKTLRQRYDNDISQDSDNQLALSDLISLICMFS